jgi:porphobilinogen synthase
MNVSRPRRNRASEAIRGLVRETSLSANDFLYPLFVKPGIDKEAIPAMPGQFRYGIDALLLEIETCLEMGIKAFDLFPVLDDSFKDAHATQALNPDGFYLQCIKAVKSRFPEAFIMTDIALDPYSSDGHDGLVVDGQIVNDETVEILAKMALLHAQAGADMVGPSDMMDGRVGAIRTQLDKAGYFQTGILSYTAKYASAFYGPFRSALDSAPRFGDKKTYQMDPANRREALREATLDTTEGADILMIKPALAYLDVIADLAKSSHLPIAAYNVSGEYSMIKAAAAAGYLDHDRAMMECLTAIKRAGASVILTYFAKEAVVCLEQGRYLG